MQKFPKIISLSNPPYYISSLRKKSFKLSGKISLSLKREKIGRYEKIQGGERERKKVREKERWRKKENKELRNWIEYYGFFVDLTIAFNVAESETKK